jgi:DNA mismatch endonuclease (patch repair protein)
VVRQIKIGSGRTAPYPEPTSAAASAIAKGNRRTDTKPEVALRSELHRRGLRFRKEFPVCTAERVVRVDIAFPRRLTAVFVDGCFWHGCPQHQRVPISNPEYWVPKLEANVERDERTNHLLNEAGWTVLRFWEHEDPEEAASNIERYVRS